MDQLGTAFGNAGDTLGNLAGKAAARANDAADDRRAAAMARKLATPEKMATEFGIDPDAPYDFLPEQQQAFDRITNMNNGLVLLSGGPGSGKVRGPVVL